MSRSANKSKSLIPMNSKTSPGSKLNKVKEDCLSSYFNMMKMKKRKHTPKMKSLKKKQLVFNSPGNKTDDNNIQFYSSRQQKDNGIFSMKENIKGIDNSSWKVLFSEESMKPLQNK